MLSGRCAIVTGAGRGLGQAVAEALARDGADLVLVSRTESELRETARRLGRYERRVVELVADVSDRLAVERAVSVALRELGRIDVLVNNAATLGPIGLLVENDPEAWAATISVNLLGPVYAMHAVLPHMIERRSGSVINVSGGGATAPRPAFSSYGASKAALVRLTETVAREVAPFNVRVNAVAPGRMNTAMRGEILAAGEAAEDEAAHDPPADALERAADLIVHLASGRSGPLTGKLLSAVHDPWAKLGPEAEQLNASSWYTLRRVDTVLAAELKAGRAGERQ
jgi:NAD(P)-dependent dehydrogenase (short-subunit alcohol dehydrogenase family)